MAKSVSILICLHAWITVRSWSKNCFRVKDTHIATLSSFSVLGKSTLHMWSFYLSQVNHVWETAWDISILGNSSYQCYAHTLSSWTLLELTLWRTWCKESLLNLILEEASWKNFLDAGGKTIGTVGHSNGSTLYLEKQFFLTVCQSREEPWCVVVLITFGVPLLYGSDLSG